MCLKTVDLDLDLQGQIGLETVVIALSYYIIHYYIVKVFLSFVLLITNYKTPLKILMSYY